MRVEKLEFERTGSFSKIFLDYLRGDPKLAPTHSFDPTVAGFEKALSYRKLSNEARNTLVDVLREQYHEVTISESVQENLEALADQKTFTVTTGHQLNIFTGPLFFVYKIVAAINMCRILGEKFPEYKFVPVYWMASEDHDFEEIDHTWVDGKKYIWKSDQQGAVGRFNTIGLAELAEKIPGNTAIFKQAYGSSKSLAEAVRSYVNELFGDTGLVVVDADHGAFKKQFAPILEEEIKKQSSNDKVNSRSEYLKEQGYKPQLNSREINLFYLDGDLRGRLEFSNGVYKVLNSAIEFSEEEIIDIIRKTPEKLSPNVILRPLYQEVILPNLGYVGGPAELAYWLQFKELFDHYKIDFPVLMPRSFGLYLDSNAQRKIAKLGLSNEDLFKQIDILKKKYVQDMNGDLTLNTERHEVEQVYGTLKQLANTIDPTLEQHIEAQLTKHMRCLDNIQSKFIKAEKRNREDDMNMINALKEYVFPGGTLQERKVNYLSINSPTFIADLLKIIDPFDLRLHIFIED